MLGGNGDLLYAHVKENETSIPYTHISTERLKDHSVFSSFNEDNLLNKVIEKPDGSGVPKQLNHSSLKPLRCIFILTHDYTHRILLEDDLELTSPKLVLDSLDESYSLGNFSKPYKALVKILDS